MDNYSYNRQQKHNAMQAKMQRAKAMEPMIRHCFIMDLDVHILVEYPEYKNPNYKGPAGEIYCSNILHCFHNDVKCRWSGISPHYPDPFNPDAPRHKPIIY